VQGRRRGQRRGALQVGTVLLLWRRGRSGSEDDMGGLPTQHAWSLLERSLRHRGAKASEHCWRQARALGVHASDSGRHSSALLLSILFRNSLSTGIGIGVNVLVPVQVLLVGRHRSSCRALRTRGHGGTQNTECNRGNDHSTDHLIACQTRAVQLKNGHGSTGLMHMHNSTSASTSGKYEIAFSFGFTEICQDTLETRAKALQYTRRGPFPRITLELRLRLSSVRADVRVLMTVHWCTNSDQSHANSRIERPKTKRLVRPCANCVQVPASTT
jgi:hypothetical protein